MENYEDDLLKEDHIVIKSYRHRKDVYLTKMIVKLLYTLTTDIQTVSHYAK